MKNDKYDVCPKCESMILTFRGIPKCVKCDRDYILKISKELGDKQIKNK